MRLKVITAFLSIKQNKMVTVNILVKYEQGINKQYISAYRRL